MPAVFCMSVTQIIQIHSSKTSCAHLAFEKWELCPCLQSREGLRSSTHGLCQHPTCLWKSTKCIINPWLWEQRIWAVNWTATGRRAMESPWLVLGRRLSGPHLRSVPLRHFRLSLGEKTLSSPMFKKRQSHFFTLPWADHQLRARRGATRTQREAGPGHGRLQKEPGTAGAPPGTFGTRRLRSLSFMSPVGFATASEGLIVILVSLGQVPVPRLGGTLLCWELQAVSAE